MSIFSFIIEMIWVKKMVVYKRRVPAVKCDRGFLTDKQFLSVVREDNKKEPSHELKI